MGIGIGPKAHTDGLKVSDQGARRKMSGTIEHHVLKIVSKAALLISLIE